jgi:hypothetical protein
LLGVKKKAIFFASLFFYTRDYSEKHLKRHRKIGTIANKKIIPLMHLPQNIIKHCKVYQSALALLKKLPNIP